MSIEEIFISIITNNKKREKVNSGNKYNKLFIVKLNRNKRVSDKLWFQRLLYINALKILLKVYEAPFLKYILN